VTDDADIIGRMRSWRPKSLSGLLLLAFAGVALFPVAAVVNATLDMKQLTRRSEALVRHGVEVTHETQELLKLIPLMEGAAGLYQALGVPKDKDAFALQRASFDASLKTLERLQPGADNARVIGRIRGDAARLAAALERYPPGSAPLAHEIEAFKAVRDSVEILRQQTGADLNSQLANVQRIAVETERKMYWQAAALLPMMVLVVLVFVSLLARPIRQIDLAISELGRGTFSRPIEIRGPSDLERLGGQLEWLRARLLDLANEKNRFLRHMSHELKTPLANIREGTELLMEGAVGPLDSNQREVAGILRENGIRLQRMIENLLSFSAWQAKAVGLELSQFSLRQLVKSVVSAQQLTLVAHRVKLDVKIQDIEITADRGKLRLILDNLMSNAVKYTPRDGTIFIHGLTYKDQLVLDVADTGPGIPKDDREHIFEAFYTGRIEQAGPVKGTGIGLSVVLEFVQAHGGSIELVDGVHPGAHFRIRLPVRPAEARPDPDAATDAAA
jgi:two-component system sensor histidine kinase GlrK